MEPGVRDMDVCVHLGSGRRCLVVTTRPDGTAACVFDDDQPFVCPVSELLSYRHPRFDAALRRLKPSRR